MLSRSYRISYLRNDDGVPYGLCLEADYVAEHEWGIGTMSSAAGCGVDYLKSPRPENVVLGRGPDEADGIDRYRPQRSRVMSGSLFILNEGTASGRVKGQKLEATYTELLFDADSAGLHPNELLYDNAEFFGEYGRDGFRLASISDEGRAFIMKLAAHARSDDIAFWVAGRSNPFGGGGFVLCMPSQVPQAGLEQLKAEHVSMRRLQIASDLTGIKERIWAAGNAFKGSDNPFHLFSLEPAWRRCGTEVAANEEVIYFINNGRGIMGWYSVPELDAWLQGGGRVIDDYRKREEQKVQAREGQAALRQ